MSMARQKTDGTRTSTRSPRKRSQAKRVSEPVISFSELDGIRYLHFGSPWVQGAMDIERPDELVLSYIQDMMAWLLFLEPPAQVLQLGLGAAALTKFTHRHWTRPPRWWRSASSCRGWRASGSACPRKTTG